ncbi:hypothetical protein [uncultured Photobacterium sp.]|uniref:hypothetical protein n=1 Tax=uncultured Photobacterium sp. TaxID=173973 RepID=UPI00260BC985|nr:hypothetical protein [uncultured Photobacterium sp.]
MKNIAIAIIVSSIIATSGYVAIQMYDRAGTETTVHFDSGHQVIGKLIGENVNYEYEIKTNNGEIVSSGPLNKLLTDVKSWKGTDTLKDGFTLYLQSDITFKGTMATQEVSLSNEALAKNMSADDITKAVNAYKKNTLVYINHNRSDIISR